MPLVNARQSEWNEAPLRFLAQEFKRAFNEGQKLAIWTDIDEFGDIQAVTAIGFDENLSEWVENPEEYEIFDPAGVISEIIEAVLAELRLACSGEEEEE